MGDTGGIELVRVMGFVVVVCFSEAGCTQQAIGFSNVLCALAAR